MLKAVFYRVNTAGYLVLKLLNYVTIQCMHVAARPRTGKLYLLVVLTGCLVIATAAGDDGRVVGTCCLHFPVRDE